MVLFSADISLNIISMGGLALGIGMLVDNSIVVLESIYRKRQQGLEPVEASIVGTSEVAMAVVSSAVFSCAATAADEDQCLAMLVRRDGETLGQLLIRLDRAIGIAAEDEAFIDEINNGPDDRL